MKYNIISDNKVRLIKANGLTDDIVTAVIDVYKQYRHTCRDFATGFVSETVENTCRNIFNYLFYEFRYKTDPEGEQLIKAPGRFVKDKEGDCKSYSILTASCLYNLGIDCAFRFVSYDNSDYSHVYVVAFCNGKEIKIDPVARVQRGLKFGNEIKFNHKKDIFMKGTRISALSGVGVVDEESGILTASSSTSKTKVNINYLYSEVNLLEAQNSIETSTQQIYQNLGKIEMLALAIRLIDRFNSDLAVDAIGLLLCREWVNGTFSVNFSDAAAGESFYSDLLYTLENEVGELLKDNSRAAALTPFSKTGSGKEFLYWWSENVARFNYVENPTISGAESYNWQAMITNNGGYFLYTSTSKTLPTRARQKAAYQQSWVNWVKSAQIGLNDASIRNCIKNGVILNYKADSNTVVNMMSQKANKSTIGDLTPSALIPIKQTPLTTQVAIDLASVAPAVTTQPKQPFNWTEFANVMTSLSQSTATILGGIASMKNTSIPNYDVSKVYTYRPEVQDMKLSTASSGGLMWLLGGGALVGLVALLLGKNKNNIPEPVKRK